MSLRNREEFVSEFVEEVRTTLHAAFMAARREGLSLKKVATVMGLDRDTVSRMLSGNEPMTLRNVSDMAFALGYQPDISIMLEES